MVMKIFDRMNQQLPAATRMLLAVTDFVNSYLLVFSSSAPVSIRDSCTMGEEEPEWEEGL